tara:strand:- start:858 stop:989 length:132 start_codon:yes stop_codon:yes gene_type:complete
LPFVFAFLYPESLKIAFFLSHVFLKRKNTHRFAYGHMELHDTD